MRDVIVVGAGPAGSSSAYYLAKKGFDVLLLDKEKFPRDKSCGDGVAPRSVSILEEMELLGKLREYQKITEAILTSPKGSVVRGKVVSEISEYPNYGFVVPRLELDSIIKDRAVDVGASFKGGVLVKAPLVDERSVRGVVDIKGNEYRARLVIAAEGSGSRIAKSLGMLVEEKQNIAVATRAYFENVKDIEDCIEIHFDEDLMPGYGWIFPTSKDSANVGAGIWLSEAREGVSLGGLFNKFVTRNKFAAKKLSSAERVSKLKGWPLPMGGYIRRMAGNGVMIVGDAACLINPLSGEGIYYALESGRTAAGVGADALEKEDLSRRTLKRYEEVCKEKFSEDYEYSVSLRSVTSDVEILNPVLERVETSNQLADLLASIIVGAIPKKKAFEEEEMMQLLMGKSS